MSYASGTKDQPQMDRLLEDIRKEIAPKAKRLFLVTSLNKANSGVIIFAKLDFYNT